MCTESAAVRSSANEIVLKLEIWVENRGVQLDFLIETVANL